MKTLLGMTSEIPERVSQLILHPFDYFQSLKGISGHKQSILFSAFIGLVSAAVRFGIDLPKTPRLSVFLAVLVVFPIMCILINLGSGYMCYTGWKIIGSKEKYPVSHACVSYISILLPVTIALNAYFVFSVAVVINFILAGTYYTIATIKAHSITPTKAIISIAGVSAVQLCFYFLIRAAKTNI